MEGSEGRWSWNDVEEDGGMLMKVEAGEGSWRGGGRREMQEDGGR